MTNSTDLNIPVILWGPEPPKHQISQIIAIQNDSIIITASFEGQIIQWNVDESNGIKPNMMLLGHEAAITCLSPTLSSNSTKYVSCCRKGYIRLWDSIDGTCIEAIQHPFVHRKIIPYTFQASSTHSTSYLYCIGDYADVVVIDGNDLNILFTLNSRVEPDWINAITVIKQQNSHDAIIGISISGMIKVWSLSDISNKTDHQNTIFEDESKSLPIKNVKGLSASNLNPKILLLITSSTWQILDINNFNPLIISECSIEAIDGVIIDEDKIAVGFIDGTIALFQLPKHKINGSESNCNNLHVEHPFVFGLLKSSKPPFNVSFNNNFAGFYFDIQQFNDKRAHRFAYRSDESGNIDITKIPDILDSLIIEVQQNKMPSIIKPIFQQSLKNIWANNKSTLPGICETENKKISATLYISIHGKLILGCNDGKIIITNACEALKSQLLDYTPSNSSHQHRIISGHSSAVTCFIYPFEESKRYDSNIFISGGKDFCVVVWSLKDFTKLHIFNSQGGSIQRFIIPPDNCNARILSTICSIANDNSVALLSLKENKCILLASRQIFPIIDIQFRPLDDLMMIRCLDDSLYVWQMETANLDRIVTGIIAEEVLEGCKEQIGIFEMDDEAGANSATQMLRAIKNKNLAAVKKIAKKTDANVDIPKHCYQKQQLSQPLKINQLNKFCNESHLLLFNVNEIFKDMNKNDMEHRDSPSTFRKISLSSLISPTKRITVSPGKQKVVVAQNAISDNIAKLLLSLIYDWEMDKSDAIKRGLQKPAVPIHFGIVSKNGIVSLYMPSNNQKMPATKNNLKDNKLGLQHFNDTLTTTHLIANIALSDAMAFNSSHEQKLKDNISAEMCHKIFHPKIQILIEKWQNSCIEIQSASQNLLLKELNKAGINERKKLITAWAPYLPVLLDSSLSILGKTKINISFSGKAALNNISAVGQQPSTISLTPSRPPPPFASDVGTDLPQISVNEQQRLQNISKNLTDFSHLYPIHGGINQIRRNQIAAIVLLGIIGTEFSNDFDQSNTVARATALSLFELLIAPESALLPLNSVIRQSAIDLIGSGFPLWQPHLDLSKILMALLDLAAMEENDEISSTAKSSLSLIASTSPKAVITAFATEVTRYNTIHQTTQITVISPLKSSKTDILRILEQMIENYFTDVIELIIPVCDILLHCLDLQLLKHQNFYDLFPPISKLHMIAYCPATKKLAIGGNNGVIVIHELKNMKSQTVQAHNSLITSMAFSSDGKFLAVYASKESKITLWQTHQTFLGMGQSQMKLIKAMTAPTEFGAASQHARLVWIGAKMLKLLLSNGSESIIQI